MFVDNIHKHIVHLSILLKCRKGIFDFTLTSAICLSKQIVTFPSVQIFDISFVEIGCVTDPDHLLSSSEGSVIRNDSGHLVEALVDSQLRY